MSRKIKKAFDGVVADEQLKLQTIQMVSKRIKNQKRSPQGYWRQFKVQAVMGLVVLFTISGFFAYQTPVSAVSIDSDYSVELRVNWFNRVVEIVGFDPQGENLANELTVTHMNYEDAMAEIMNAFGMETEEVYVTVASRQASRASEMMANIESHKGMMRQHMTMYQSTEGLMKQAREKGVSIGRMRAMMELRDLEEEGTLESAEELPMDELIETIESHHNEMQKHMKENNSPNGSMKNKMMQRNNSEN
ncbi:MULTISPECIES: anti-sigma-I factor RsgI family protein [unclassified Jeotgalibaca]|uniref:anti-sigma-I factor RsgI family protein n=1 Tax=unclassified Jeotgalibaca TaxID=2621505 RepID=UPI003FD179A1